jgi:hypothetical protein
VQPFICALVGSAYPLTLAQPFATYHVADLHYSCFCPCLDYATYPLLDNRLVPFSAGSAALTLGFGGSNTSVAVSILDTYQPAWPQTGPATDKTLEIAANMTAPGFTITFHALPSAALDLQGSPPSPGDIEGGGGVALVADPARGPSFYAAIASGLTPGTNYTLLLAVRSGLVLSGGVTALAGALVPDTQPPSFTAATLVEQVADLQTGTLTLDVDLGLDETGAVAYALYGDPHCITGGCSRHGDELRELV